MLLILLSRVQLQLYFAALSLSFDLLTAIMQCLTESSSLLSLSARLRLLFIFLFFRCGVRIVSFSWADSNDSDDDFTQPSAGVFSVVSGSDDANSAWCCVVAVRRSNDNESAAVFSEFSWYCCNCFMCVRLCLICTGARAGCGLPISSGIIAL